MDRRIIEPYVSKLFNTEIIPALSNFIRIPNVSPNYDENWNKNGYQLEAAKFIINWVNNQKLKNCNVTYLKEPDRTPFIFIEIGATNLKDNRTFLMYGHMDKQPPFVGWSQGFDPYIPVIKEKYLYGRGSSDDGYAPFAAITSIKTCQDNNWPLPRIVILIEGAEESNTADLIYYVTQLQPIIKTPSLIICLDSGCEDYKRLWVSTTLRGVISMDLKVSMLNIGVHSGGFGGIVADSFTVLRLLLDRLEDNYTGKMKDEFLFPIIPKDRLEQIEETANIMGDHVIKAIPFYEKTEPLTKDIVELIKNNTWRPTICVTGGEGLPETKSAGNVLRPFTRVKLSVRLPPLVDAKKAYERMIDAITKDVPYNAKVELLNTSIPSDGWNLEKYSTKLDNILNIASRRFFNNERKFFGEGGSIPFVQFFADLFPKADLAVMGVTGPGSNIHGPDENLDLTFCKNLICCITYLISDY